MLTRRGFAACALCAISGFAATAAEAAPSATPGLKRTILQRMDGPAPGYETLLVVVDIDADALVARHTHPGVEVTYVLEGETELIVEGQAPLKLSPGKSAQVPTGIPHSAKNGDKPTRLAVTYVVEKGKPLASPA
jgi:quercetin dioxygenase-like cupin family protein